MAVVYAIGVVQHQRNRLLLLDIQAACFAVIWFYALCQQPLFQVMREIIRRIFYHNFFQRGVAAKASVAQARVPAPAI
ncbi:hypothetical protein [Hymenobacter nivis]|uniref:Uncharacterized protein n=1 Tax=Hymenobacter nivis TaxID=1850093 RepID=A0A502GN77_9BACT|nr:hypothetical protein [Hymenobacter nivis]TPG62343.1 hypothetical protein EAH73_19290 [Hymenobacter nivis]